jgi:heme/copper-type cytochrome/quinol oxidase subunit 2
MTRRPSTHLATDRLPGDENARGSDRHPNAGVSTIWVLVYGAIAGAIVLGEVAVNVAARGAASDSQQTTLGWSMTMAVVLGVLGVAGLLLAHRRQSDTAADRRRSGRARAVVWVGAAAVAIELARAAWFTVLTVRDAQQHFDGPTEVLVGVIQIAIALVVGVGVAALALYERRAAQFGPHGADPHAVL